MDIQQFVQSVRDNRIPSGPPMPPGIKFRDNHQAETAWARVDRNLEWWVLRRECNVLGMWAIVNKIMARSLSDHIKIQCGRNITVLEVMAGRGWLSKALRDCGLKIISTDNQSWAGTHSFMPAVTSVITMGGKAAVKKYSNADVMIMSWPPMKPAAGEIIKAWGDKRPVIYIGEGSYGCTATENFWNHFSWGRPLDINGFFSWPSIHDAVYMGYYKP
jgi:hypothetical protein